jgi:hypothetical protein
MAWINGIFAGSCNLKDWIMYITDRVSRAREKMDAYRKWAERGVNLQGIWMYRIVRVLGG